MTRVSRASRSSITVPLPRDAKSPSVDSRIKTKLARAARGSGEHWRCRVDDADRPDTGIQPQIDAEVDLGRDLRSIGTAHGWKTHRAEKDRVGPADGLSGLRRHGLAGIAIGGRRRQISPRRRLGLPGMPA
jgi:hypothetical protein